MTIPIYARCIAFLAWLLLTHYGADAWKWVREKKAHRTLLRHMREWSNRGQSQPPTPSYANLPWQLPFPSLPYQPAIGDGAYTYTTMKQNTAIDIDIDDIRGAVDTCRPSCGKGEALVLDNNQLYWMKYPEPWMLAGVPMFETGT